MAGMRVLVTGADGYIGAVLGPTLLEQGFDVVGVDCGFYRDGWLYNDDRPRPLTFTKDIRRIIPKDVEGFDAVVHLAELSNDPLGELSERTTYEINHLGSVTLARACKQAGVPRLVYTSSCSVYGAAEDGGERSEQSAPNPQTAYARCKVLVERDVGELADTHFSPIFLRNATAFGLSPRMRFDIVLNNLAGFAWTTKETSFAKIRRHLPEFRCLWPAQLGARQLREIFERVQMTEEIFLFRGFTRLEQLKHLVATQQIDSDFYWRPLRQQTEKDQPE